MLLKLTSLAAAGMMLASATADAQIRTRTPTPAIDESSISLCFVRADENRGCIDVRVLSTVMDHQAAAIGEFVRDRLTNRPTSGRMPGGRPGRPSSASSIELLGCAGRGAQQTAVYLNSSSGGSENHSVELPDRGVSMLCRSAGRTDGNTQLIVNQAASAGELLIQSAGAAARVAHAMDACRANQSLMSSVSDGGGQGREEIRQSHLHLPLGRAWAKVIQFFENLGGSEPEVYQGPDGAGIRGECLQDVMSCADACAQFGARAGMASDIQQERFENERACNLDVTPNPEDADQCYGELANSSNADWAIFAREFCQETSGRLGADCDLLTVPTNRMTQSTNTCSDPRAMCLDSQEVAPPPGLQGPAFEAPTPDPQARR